MIADPEPRDGGEEEVLFDAELTPHRSLPPEGFVLLMGLVGLVSFAAGALFFVVGAWPVVGFLGLDLLLIYLAFRASYRSGRAYETLRLTRRDLTLKRVDSWGRAQRLVGPPAAVAGPEGQVDQQQVEAEEADHRPGADHEE